MVLLLEAPWSVYAADSWNCSERESEEILKARDARLSILGICFGGQVIARSFGGIVPRAPHYEIGWHPVDSYGESLIPGGDWFQFHYDRGTTPPLARTLASSPKALQAFQMDTLLSLQFHPEVNVSVFRTWLDAGADVELGSL
ncbi:type 1 glutamine amidotransferase [Ferrithrix thermotolerans]|uniref:type 1 glutamine amidotransferase n=1 Tax=Ferrithrix thermotolerans TaxID=209649 RepID=UPI000933104E|nr:hypothetical protein [Ferrithrix thermotolerans]